MDKLSAHRPSSSSARSNPAPRTRPPDPGMAELKRADQEGKRSLFNGFKLMSRNVRDAIQQTDDLFPANIHGFRRERNVDERAVVFHDSGQEQLVPGQLRVGKEGAVKVPRDVTAPTARVFVHSHPYTGRHYYYEPSMGDQIVARDNPNVEHIIQTPYLNGANQYFTYTGAVPPRYYKLLPNPDNLPVPPNSPDGARPPFRMRHEAGG